MKLKSSFIVKKSFKENNTLIIRSYTIPYEFNFDFYSSYGIVEDVWGSITFNLNDISRENILKYNKSKQKLNIRLFLSRENNQNHSIDIPIETLVIGDIKYQLYDDLTKFFLTNSNSKIRNFFFQLKEDFNYKFNKVVISDISLSKKDNDKIIIDFNITK